MKKETRRVKIMKKCANHDSISECGDCGMKFYLLPASEQMTTVLLEVKNKFPRWRFGQIIANAMRMHDGRINCDPFYISDEDLLKALKKL